MVGFPRLNALSSIAVRLSVLCRVTLIGLIVTGSCSLLLGADRPGTDSTLSWRNGDQLTGRIVGGNVETILWANDQFQEPLQLQLDALHMIRFPRHEEQHFADRREAEQIIETRSGNRFFGTITASDDTWLSVRSDLFGELRLLRSEVSLISNPVERAHVYSGPKGLRGWSTLTYGRRLSEWEEIAGGRLHTRLVAAELFRSLPAQGSVDMDVEFLWRNNPSFQIRFLTPYASPTKETIKVETRSTGYEIQVLGSSGRFRKLDTMPRDARVCRLHLRWNHAAGELSVFRDRKYLGKLSVEQQRDAGPAGVFIKNTGPQLTLSKLEVRASSSLDPDDSDPSQDTILIGNNQSFAGTVTDLSPNGVTISDGDEDRTWKWGEVVEVSFRQMSSPKDPVELIECIFHNGETLEGRLVAANDSTLQIEVRGIEEPVPCRLDLLERVTIGQKTIPPNSKSLSSAPWSGLRCSNGYTDQSCGRRQNCHSPATRRSWKNDSYSP